MIGDETRGGAPTPARRLVDYYRFLEVSRNARTEEIVAAYLAKVQGADARTVERAERALAVLSDAPTRAAYDQDLAASQRVARSAPATERSAAQASAAAGRSRLATGASSATRPRRTAPAAGPRRPAAPPPEPAAVNITWRWALVAIPILLLAGFLLLNNNRTGTPGSGASAGVANSQLQAQAVTAPLGADGVQTLNLVVNGDTMSYKPRVIRVKQGVPVRFNLSVEGRDPG